MPRRSGPPKPPEPPDKGSPSNSPRGENITDDPLAAIDPGRAISHQKIYSVSRSVFLPRVTIKNGTLRGAPGQGVNPLFVDTNQRATSPPRRPQSHRHSSSRDKSTSSGYGDSCSEALYQDHLKLMEDVGVILEQNPAFVKSIRIASRGLTANKSSHSSSSGGGTLTTIPEGQVDLPVPEPIWPLHDSLVDDALLLYTSLNYQPDQLRSLEAHLDMSVKDLLLELLRGINDTLEGKSHTGPEEMLRIVDEQIRLRLRLLRASAEEEVRRLCVSMSNCRTKNCVLRALGQESSASSGSEASSRGSLEGAKPNAGVCGTWCGGGEALLKKGTLPKRLSLLRDVRDERPSVWQQYYGVRAAEEGEVRRVAKPADVPLFPGGRPETDFTLDVPRSDHLLKRMEEDKKWRCRCRVLTSFLGIVFFLLSVMAVSLILTRGKRMFGSMV